MHEHSLARDLWPQLEGIAQTNQFRRVHYVQMVVGMLHGVTAEMLEHSFEHVFEGTCFHGADINVTVVEIGEQFKPQGSDETITATGWEILVVRMEGMK